MSRENISAWVTGCVCAAISAFGAFYRAEEKATICPPVTQEQQDVTPRKTPIEEIRAADEPLVRFSGTGDGQMELDNAARW